MASVSLKKSIREVFFPAILLSVFLGGASAFLLLSKNTILETQLNYLLIPGLKVPVIPCRIILGLLLLVFAISKPFEKVFRGTLITIIGVVTFLTVLMLFQKQIEVAGQTEVLTMHKPFMRCFSASLFYTVLSLLSFNLLSILIWGFVNRLANSFEGEKFYIMFAFVLSLLGGGVTGVGLFQTMSPSLPLLATSIPAIVLLVGSLIIFNWSWKRLPETTINPEKALSSVLTRFPFLSAAYLLAGCMVIKSFLLIPFKYKLSNQFADPVSYTKFLCKYSIVSECSELVVSIVWVVLGTWLMKKKGWKITAFFAALSLLVGGFIFLVSYPEIKLMHWLSQGVFTGFLTGTSFALFFPMIQVLYLYMPFQNRFTAKIITELIALPLMISVPNMLTQLSIFRFGSISVISQHFRTLIPFLLVLLLFASRGIGTRFSDKISTKAR